MESFENLPSNPLAMFMRQPKIYIKLPSRGEYWPKGSLDIPETGEYPVYSMTAKDELQLKIPDALMNGQAVVDVIQHCMPNIKNAWSVPSLDLDVILIAIRLATYGEFMEVPVTASDDEELTYKVDLRIILDSLTQNISWDPAVSISPDLTIFVRPLSYKQITASSLQTFETQKIIQVANDEDLPEDEKLKLFKESFSKLTNITIGVVRDSIFRVDTSNGSTENASYIKEFIDNADKEIFNKVQLHLEKLAKQNSVKPLKISVTEEMKIKGINTDTIEIPLVFDPSTFFA